MIKIIQIYAKIHEIIKEIFGFNIRGLGFLYRQIKYDFIIEVKGKKMFFSHKISDNYGRLINGNYNEKETHYFLDKIFEESKINNFHFVDIGGNVGEFVLDYSSNLNVKFVTVFEPQFFQQVAIQKTIDLNHFSNCKLINKPVSDKVEEVFFNFNETNSTASGITNDKIVGKPLLATTIDDTFKDKKDTFVFLIDTEGAELKIMNGGINLIKDTLPIIIFEYNHVTRKHFSIDEVKLLLGSDYKIYRLNKFGLLDSKFDNIWNLVALPNSSKYSYLQKQVS